MKDRVHAVFIDKHSGAKNRKLGPYESITFMYECMVADGEEIAHFDRNGSGMWEIKEDGTKWSELEIKQ